MTLRYPFFWLTLYIIDKIITCIEKTQKYLPISYNSSALAPIAQIYHHGITYNLPAFAPTSKNHIKNHQLKALVPNYYQANRSFLVHLRLILRRKMVYNNDF